MIQFEIPVRWRDIDANGHVNNAVFFTYLEEGRDRLFESLGATRTDFVTVHIDLDFIQAISCAETSVVVKVRCQSVGTTSLTTNEEILVGGEQMATATVVSVRVDTKGGKPIPLEEAWVQDLAG